VGIMRVHAVLGEEEYRAVLLGAERRGVSLEGEIDDPGGWYATVRAGTAALYASASGGEGVPGVLASTPGQGTVRKD
jgi:hypothetical protein